MSRLGKEKPKFWAAEGSSLPRRFLWPASKLYRAGARLRQAFSRQTKVDVPVICIGNAVVGGAGKTPVCLSLANMLKDIGYTVHICSKGYGGSLTEKPVQVNKQTAAEVGDEPLLLARVAPTWVAKNRAEGLEAAVYKGAPQVVLMDDGLQNPTVAKDFCILVVDGGYGFGNQKTLPAGPLREPIPTAMDQIGLMIVIGKDTYNVGMLVSLRHNIPIIRADIVLSVPQVIQDQPVLAFAGIGRPQKFFDSLSENGKTRIVSTAGFPDHHQYTDNDLGKLKRQAKQFKAKLVTTEKDYVRLSPTQKEHVTPIPMTLKWQEESIIVLKQSLIDAIKTANQQTKFA